MLQNKGGKDSHVVLAKTVEREFLRGYTRVEKRERLFSDTPWPSDLSEQCREESLTGRRRHDCLFPVQAPRLGITDYDARSCD